MQHGWASGAVSEIQDSLNCLYRHNRRWANGVVPCYTGPLPKQVTIHKTMAALEQSQLPVAETKLAACQANERSASFLFKKLSPHLPVRRSACFVGGSTPLDRFALAVEVKRPLRKATPVSERSAAKKRVRYAGKVKMLRDCILLLAFYLIPQGSIFANEQITWMEYPEAGVVIGQGYNLLEHKPAHGTCVTFVPIQDPSQEISYRFQEVTSTTDIRSQLNISASGSLQMAILNASARLNFLSNEKFHLDTKKFLLRATVTNSSLFAAPSVGFKKGLLILGSDTPPAQYVSEHRFGSIELSQVDDRFNTSKCGHGFVAAIISGAEIDAFLTWSRTDANSLANITGGVEANIAEIFSVRGSLESRQQSQSIKESTSVSVFKVGGSSGNIAYDLDGLKNSLNQLAIEASTLPKPIRIGVLPYSSLSSSPVASNIQAQVFRDAVAAYFLSKDVFQRTSDVIDNYYHFDDTGTIKSEAPVYIHPITSYLELNGKSRRLANQLSSWLSHCRASITQFANNLPPNRDGAGSDLSLLSQLRPSDEAQGRSLVTINQLDTMENDLADLSPVEVERNVGLCAVSGKVKLEETEVTAPLRQMTNSAIVLAAREISLRPIYWDEFSNARKRTLSGIKAQLGNKTPAEVTGEVGEELTEFSLIQRSTQLLRDICGKSFEHPICATEESQFTDVARPQATVRSVNLVAIPIPK